MASEILLRPLNLQDSLSIHQILADLLDPGLPKWDQDQIRAELDRGIGIGAFDTSGTLLSFVLYEKQIDHIDISFVATRRDMQHRGIMTQILKTLKADYANLPFWLEVHENNVTACKLYERLGFSKVGRRASYYRDGGSAFLYSTNI